MVSTKMAAVLAVALLLLCSSVRSSAEEVQGTITQVKISDSPTTAPAITNTTEGSSDSHSAVLANEVLGADDNAPLVLVDLARSDQENMTTMSATPPTSDSVPSGFDMSEPDDAVPESFAESTTPPAVDAVPPGFDMNEFDDDSQSFAVTQDQGTLVQGYPAIGSSEDNSQGQGYGVLTYDASSARTEDDSSFAVSTEDEDLSLATTQDQGTLVQGYPAIGSSEDNSQGQGYGVLTYDASASEGDALAVYGEEVPDSTENYTLTTPRTYRPMPPKPAPAEAWRKGRCTYYGGMDAAGTMSGACGYGNLYASGYGVYTAALSAMLFNNGMACGACYEVACSGKGKPCKAGSIVVTATNFCPPNPGQSANNGGWCNPPNEHFDLSYPAFTKIADPKAGIVPLQFRRVPCKKLGGIRFTLNGNCNFNLVTITNVGGSGVVIEVYMKGDYMPWAPMSRNWGANWQCTRNYCGKAISIKIVTSDKKVAISKLAGKDWAFGKTYVGQQVK